MKQNKKRTDKKGEYLIDDEDDEAQEHDEENPVPRCNNNSDSDELDEGEIVNENNLNYNDILDQDEE